jgi:hypothetical protein
LCAKNAAILYRLNSTSLLACNVQYLPNNTAPVGPRPFDSLLPYPYPTYRRCRHMLDAKLTSALEERARRRHRH